jgi:hypothetical protein
LGSTAFDAYSFSTTVFASPWLERVDFLSWIDIGFEHVDNFKLIERYLEQLGFENGSRLWSLDVLFV